MLYFRYGLISKLRKKGEMGRKKLNATLLNSFLEREMGRFFSAEERERMQR
jgi:hypothetical protein